MHCKVVQCFLFVLITKPKYEATNTLNIVRVVITNTTKFYKNKHDCDQIYVGQTKRSLNVKFQGNFSHLKYKRFNESSVALHMLENQHQVGNVKFFRVF